NRTVFGAPALPCARIRPRCWVRAFFIGVPASPRSVVVRAAGGRVGVAADVAHQSAERLGRHLCLPAIVLVVTADRDGRSGEQEGTRLLAEVEAQEMHR